MSLNNEKDKKSINVCEYMQCSIKILENIWSDLIFLFIIVILNLQKAPYIRFANMLCAKKINENKYNSVL